MHFLVSSSVSQEQVDTWEMGWTLGRWGGQLGEGMRERNKVLVAL